MNFLFLLLLLFCAILTKKVVRTQRKPLINFDIVQGILSMKKYSKSDWEEIESNAYDMSGRHGWSAKSSLETAISLFNLKNILIGLLSLIVAAFVIITFVTDAFDSIKEKWQNKFHTCEENLVIAGGTPDPYDGVVYFSCSVCYKRDVSSVEPKKRTITTPEHLVHACTGSYLRIEKWTWEIQGQTFEEDDIWIYTEGEEFHENTYVTAEGYEKTCTTDGLSDEIVCMDCRLVVQKSEVIPMGHDTIVVNGVEPDCINEGYTGDTVCQMCDELIEYGTTIAVADHNYQLIWERSPTCINEGYTGDLSCTGCGDIKEYGSVIPTVDHDYYYAGQHPYTGKYTYICGYCRRDEFRDTKN